MVRRLAVYNKVLDDRLKEQGLSHEYCMDGLGAHFVTEVIREWVQGGDTHRDTRRVARFVSEAQAGVDDSSRQRPQLTYRGLELKVFEPNYANRVERAANKISSDLGEWVDVV